MICFFDRPSRYIKYFGVPYYLSQNKATSLRKQFKSRARYHFSNNHSGTYSRAELDITSATTTSFTSTMRFSLFTVALAFTSSALAAPNSLDKRVSFICPSSNVYPLCCPVAPPGLPSITADVGCNAAAAIVYDSSCPYKLCCDSIATTKFGGQRAATGSDCVYSS